MSAGEVAIVGGGPVGLYLALSLLREGITPRVFEKRSPGPRSGSRSIGIHPPSIELFDELGLGEELLARAVRIERGLAIGEDGPIGDLSFDACPGPHRFVAALEQWKTETVLEGALAARAPDALIRGSEVLRVEAPDERPRLVVRTGGDVAEEPFDAVVAADGKHSAVRRSLGVPLEGSAYPGDYAMTDAPDATSLGRAAAIFLGPRGLVESFPLPDRARRWVIRRDEMACTGERPSASGAELARTVRERTGHVIGGGGMPSSFRAERYLARCLSVGRSPSRATLPT